ncbi:unnamed protein product [Caenorhabditis brenneri]
MRLPTINHDVPVELLALGSVFTSSTHHFSPSNSLRSLTPPPITFPRDVTDDSLETYEQSVCDLSFSHDDFFGGARRKQQSFDGVSEWTLEPPDFS